MEYKNVYTHELKRSLCWKNEPSEKLLSVYQKQVLTSIFDNRIYTNCIPSYIIRTLELGLRERYQWRVVLTMLDIMCTSRKTKGTNLQYSFKSPCIHYKFLYNRNRNSCDHK
jgi:hypothetical protein